MQGGSRYFFQAQLKDFFIVYFTPFCPPLRSVDCDIPCLRTHLCGLRITDREGCCLCVVWAKDRHRILKFRYPDRGRWLQRLIDEWKTHRVRLAKLNKQASRQTLN